MIDISPERRDLDLAGIKTICRGLKTGALIAYLMPGRRDTGTVPRTPARAALARLRAATSGLAFQIADDLSGCARGHAPRTMGKPTQQDEALRQGDLRRSARYRRARAGAGLSDLVNAMLALTA